MSGHSKWSNIKRKKEIIDSKKGKIFSKMSRLITVSARQGGGDINMNPALRLAVDRAKQARMPKENIERAIQKGAGGGEKDSFTEVVYEGYGPEGIAVLASCLTDNRNRTVSEIRNIFTRFGGSLGDMGSTAYIFSNDPQNPIFTIELKDESTVKKIANFIEELEDNDDVQEIFTNHTIPDNLLEVS